MRLALRLSLRLPFVHFFYYKDPAPEEIRAASHNPRPAAIASLVAGKGPLKI